MPTILHESGHVINTIPVLPTRDNVKVISTQGGVNISQGQTTLDKVLATTLSLFALHKGAGYVPTTEQPQQQTYLPQYDPRYISNIDTQDTASGKVETWLKENTGVALIAGGFLLFYLLPSPRKGR